MGDDDVEGKWQVRVGEGYIKGQEDPSTVLEVPKFLFFFCCCCYCCCRYRCRRCV